MAYMLSSNMDQGSTEFQIEAAISKVFASVSLSFSAKMRLVCCKITVESLLSASTVFSILILK